MYDRPVLDQAQSPARQLTLHDIETGEIDRRLVLTISGVKVWRRMVVEKHSNQDPLEDTDRWHPLRQVFQLTRMIPII